MQPSEQPIPKTPLAFFMYISRDHWRIACLAIVLVILASALGQGTSYFFKLIVDAVEAGDLNQALWWGLMYPVAILVVQLLFRASGVSGALWSNRARKTGVDTVNSYAIHHSHSYYADRFSGSVINKIRNIVDAVEHTIPDFLWGHLNAFTAFIVSFVLISSVDLLSGLLFIVFLTVLIVLNQLLAPKKAVYARANAEAGSALQGRLADVFGNISAVRQYTQVETELNALKELTTQKRTAGIRNWLYTEKMLLINSFVLFAFGFLIFWILINKWAAGEIGTGDFVLVLALVSQITGSLLFIGRAFNSTARMIGEMREGLEELMQPYEIVDHPDAKELTVSKAHISWENVTFQYTGETVFENFSLEINGYQRLGLVGPSGAGKSTFVSLLLRQHDIGAGNISIDGQNIANITQKSLRANIAVVPQEPALFHRTIRENIAYSRPDATDEEIIAVAKKARAHEFIVTLPEGYNTLVGERGVKLSGGQKQRVAIARAMLKNAPILILDEATSALDSESEVAIQEALEELMKGKTVIAIAHRLSTLRRMDRIVVLNNGQIAEDGNHAELSTRGGVYQNLWEHQAGGFVGD